MSEYLAVSNSIGAWLRIDDDTNIITDCAPVLNKFKGQHISNLYGWLVKHGEVAFHPITTEDTDNDD